MHPWLLLFFSYGILAFHSCEAMDTSKQLNITVEAYSPVGRSGHSGDIRDLAVENIGNQMFIFIGAPSARQGCCEPVPTQLCLHSVSSWSCPNASFICWHPQGDNKIIKSIAAAHNVSTYQAAHLHMCCFVHFRGMWPNGSKGSLGLKG